MKRSGGWKLTVAGLAALALLALVPLAALADATSERSEYTAKAEPICKSNVEANRQIFKGAKEQVKAGELKKASKHFTRAATAFGKTIRQLEALPRPPADETALTKWFGLLGDEKGLIEQIGKALGKEERRKAESVSVSLKRNSSKTNNAVLSFGFNYCYLEQSRFG